MDIQKALKLLGLTEKSSLQDLKAVYRNQVKRWHPDRFTNAPDTKAIAEERIKDIIISYREVKAFLARRESRPNVFCRHYQPTDEIKQKYEPAKHEFNKNIQDRPKAAQRKRKRSFTGFLATALKNRKAGLNFHGTGKVEPVERVRPVSRVRKIDKI